MTRIVAHLIVGSRLQPYLAATLQSISESVSELFVNDNSGWRVRSFGAWSPLESQPARFASKPVAE